MIGSKSVLNFKLFNLNSFTQEQLTGAMSVIEGQLKSLAETGLLQGQWYRSLEGFFN